MEKKVKELWEKYQDDAEWEPVDQVDTFSLECNIRLEVDGFVFGGYGYKCGEGEYIEEMFCDCPDGSTIKII